MNNVRVYNKIFEIKKYFELKIINNKLYIMVYN